ncbi:MAG: hypothetical protein PHE68_06055 [Candidatus Peribacteraceae bacterium]|nr:hypothetical protein [Candidatus Peribacteraceae bacterium]MDD5074380.1 hypothetical protein [Candidatus Peribacteraceae bacterium]
MKTNRFTVQLFTAFLSVAVAAPFLVSAMGTGHFNQLMSEQALANKETIRAQRRLLTRLNSQCGRETEQTKNIVCKAYLIVQKECLARQSIRQQTGCPVINDLVRIAQVQEALIKGEPISGSGASASSAAGHGTAVKPTMKDLSASQRLQLRHAIQMKYCSEKLPEIMYLLCIEAVGENQSSAPLGLINDISNNYRLRESAGAKTLKDRIEMTIPVER